MSEERETLDVGSSPDLQSLVRTVRERGEPVVLRSGEEELALVVPIGRRNGAAPEPASPRDRARWKADLLALAGTLSDADAEAMLAAIDRARHFGLPDEPQDE
jgi:hypothetical protein